MKSVEGYREEVEAVVEGEEVASEELAPLLGCE